MPIDGIYLLGLNKSERKSYSEEIQSSIVMMPSYSSRSDEWTEADGPGWIVKTVARPQKLGIPLPGFAPQLFMRVRQVDTMLCITEEGAVKGAPNTPARTRYSPGKPLLPLSLQPDTVMNWSFEQNSKGLTTTHEVSLTIKGILKSKFGVLWWVQRSLEEEGGLHQSDEFYLPGVGELARRTQSSLAIGMISGLKRLTTAPGPVDKETILGWSSGKVEMQTRQM